MVAEITDEHGIVYEEVDYNTYLKSSTKHRIIKFLEHQYFVEKTETIGKIIEKCKCKWCCENRRRSSHNK